MSNVTYAQMNIGRNVGTEPMDADRWEWFKATASSVLRDAQRLASGMYPCATRLDVQTHEGTGRWGDVTEDSAHVSLYWEDGIDLDHVTAMARVLCQMFDQDAIAVIGGSELVTA